MEVKGYKIFNKDKTNRYGKEFVEGKKYIVGGKISFGNRGNGFHMCVHLSDVFRYVDTEDNDFVVAEVKGSGQTCLHEEPNCFEGYYDMYSCSEIKVVRFLSRKEIIDLMLEANEFEVLKFIRTFKLTTSEAIQFYKKFRSCKAIVCALMYYHFDYKNVYEDVEKKKTLTFKKVFDDGEDNS